MLQDKRLYAQTMKQKGEQLWRNLRKSKSPLRPTLTCRVHSTNPWTRAADRVIIDISPESAASATFALNAGA